MKRKSFLFCCLSDSDSLLQSLFFFSAISLIGAHQPQNFSWVYLQKIFRHNRERGGDVFSLICKREGSQKGQLFPFGCCKNTLVVVCGSFGFMEPVPVVSQ